MERHLAPPAVAALQPRVIVKASVLPESIKSYLASVQYTTVTLPTGLKRPFLPPASEEGPNGYQPSSTRPTTANESQATTHQQRLLAGEG